MRRKFFTEWSYVNLTLAAFVFSPELRRLATWHASYDPHNVFSIVPTAMLVPIGFFVYKRRSTVLASGYQYAAWIWTFAFVYAFLIGVALKSIVPGVYGLGLFLLPILMGAWFVAVREPLERSYARLSGALLFYGALAGAYGIFQFIVAPPWDTAWMINIGSVAFGSPQPFAIRVFSVMNSPGTYAEFTAISLILNLPNLRLSRPLTGLAMILMTVGMVLSLVRVAWLAVVIGALVFIVASPERKRAVVSLVTISLTLAALTAGFFTAFPNDEVKDTLTDRLSSLTNVSNDGSTVARENTSQQALYSALANPLGHGLGLTGPPAALADPKSLAQSDLPAGDIDNGFLSRFVEMGYFGLAAFLFAVFVALFQTLLNLLRYRAQGEPGPATVVAACFAAQLTLLLVAVSGDVYSGVGGVIFFIAFALGIKRSDVSDASAASAAAFSDDGRAFGVGRNRARRMPTS